MEVYRRITERVRGALWAHHRRLMPERQFHRILAYVYNNKYEYQLRFDRMEVVGHEYEGRVEVVATPSGYLKRVRVHPSVEDLTPHQQKQLILSAYAKACKEGHDLMAQAETQVYRQFLKDLKPIVMGIRDNPEFYTVAEESHETVGATMLGPNGPSGTASSSTAGHLPHRTIPMAKAVQPSDEVRRRHQSERAFMEKNPRWRRTLRGKEFLSKYSPESRPPGAPGAKTKALPLDLPAPYMSMDEARLLRRNWVAYLDNKHVAENLWTRSQIADRDKELRRLQETGQAWHRPVR